MAKIQGTTRVEDTEPLLPVGQRKVWDMNMRILNVVPKFPGCTHDAFIWQSSKLKAAFGSGCIKHGEGWLLGESGYPNELNLHTPHSSFSPGSSEVSYNNAHKSGRCVIERCNGVLKNRFRCLLRHRILHYMPEVASRIVNACVILHNFCIEGDMEWHEFELPVEDELFYTIAD